MTASSPEVPVNALDALRHPGFLSMCTNWQTAESVRFHSDGENAKAPGG